VIKPSIPVPETIIQIAATTPVRSPWSLGGLFAGLGIAAIGGFHQGTGNAGEQKKKVIKEFQFKKGILVATVFRHHERLLLRFASRGSPIGDASLAAGTTKIWTGLPAHRVLLGGFRRTSSGARC